MWRLKCSAGEHPHLFSLNAFAGRQVWEYHPGEEAEAEKEAVERAREEFTKNVHRRKHSSDEVLRIQAKADRERRGQPQTRFPPPPGSFPEGENPKPELVEQSLRGALDFYQGLQASHHAVHTHPHFQSPPLVS